MPLVATDCSWVVCMPKKTGSQSVVGMCEELATVEGDWHGGKWDGTGRRYMVVRDPRSRLASLYWYSRLDGWNGGPGGPAEWFERFLAERQRSKRDREWTDAQTELHAEFRPDRVFRLETELPDLLVLLGYSGQMQYRNVTPTKRGTSKPYAETFTGDEPGLVEWLALDGLGVWY